jgi:hypothetical protein
LQVFLLTVVFGLFHGLVFLPVILTILGPKQKDDSGKYESSDVTNTTDNDIVVTATTTTTATTDEAKTINVVGAGLINPAFVNNESKEVNFKLIDIGRYFDHSYDYSSVFFSLFVVFGTLNAHKKNLRKPNIYKYYPNSNLNYPDLQMYDRT